MKISLLKWKWIATVTYIVVSIPLLQGGLVIPPFGNLLAWMLFFGGCVGYGVRPSMYLVAALLFHAALAWGTLLGARLLDPVMYHETAAGALFISLSVLPLVLIWAFGRT
jgi:hypothetical protein